MEASVTINPTLKKAQVCRMLTEEEKAELRRDLLETMAILKKLREQENTHNV